MDWYTYSGYRRYHSECHVCHGPDGMGSTYAPALTNSLKTMSYGDFVSVVASGRKNVSTSQENVMPALGDNPNVACYMDDLYIYLRARANDAVGRARPAKKEDKPEAYTAGGEFLHGQEMIRRHVQRTGHTRSCSGSKSESGVENEDTRCSRVRSQEAPRDR